MLSELLSITVVGEEKEEEEEMLNALTGEEEDCNDGNLKEMDGIAC